MTTTQTEYTFDDLEAIGTNLPLAELYERVDFAAAAREAADEADEWGLSV